MRYYFMCFIFCVSCAASCTAAGGCKGQGNGSRKAVNGATVTVAGSRNGVVTDTAGYLIYLLHKKGSVIKYPLLDSRAFRNYAQDIENGLLVIMMEPVAADLSEIVVTGTLKEVSRMQSPYRWK